MKLHIKMVRPLKNPTRLAHQKFSKEADIKAPKMEAKTD